MTSVTHSRWPLYVLLGAAGALALGRACAWQRRQQGQHRRRHDEIRELDGRWWDVNGQRMHARVATDSARNARLPLVLVHGLGVSGAYFVPAAQRLATEFDVYVPDLPGHGLSHTPAVQPDIAGLAQALVDWMDAAGLARVALVGHSMGCQVAVQAALRNPGRIDRMVLIAPAPDPAARTAVQQAGRLIMGGVFERPSLFPHVLKDYWRIGSRFLPEFRHMLAYPIEAKLPEIGVPVMLIRGEHDFIAPQAWLDEAARLLRAPSQVVIPYWGHAVQFSGAEQVAGAMRSFLAAGV
jgi:2-hydroxy-6-oxonona-2,4-dienedioate hydrolase